MKEMAFGPVLVLGLGDVASAVACRLFDEGFAVALHADQAPKTHRRAMAFADAFWDGTATLGGRTCRRCEDLSALRADLERHSDIPLLTAPLAAALAVQPWAALVDARMRKRAEPKDQRRLAPLVIGLGPGFIAGGNVDLAIETQWGDHLGTVLPSGPTAALAGEPRSIEGVGRARFVYAPVAGVLRTRREIGDAVDQGDVLATLGTTAIRATCTGTLSGLTHDGVEVAPGDKIVEVDPRPPDRAEVSGLGQRPSLIGEGVVQALRAHVSPNDAAVLVLAYLADDGAAYERSFGRWTGRLARALIDFAKLPGDGPMLDVGCGTGRLAGQRLRRSN